MSTQTQPKLEGRFEWNTPEVVTSFLQGEDSQNLYESLGDYITKLEGISYDSETKTIIGSTPFLAAGVDSLVRPLGIRVANLRELSRPEVMNMIKGKHYSDIPFLVLRSMKDSYERNQPLIQRLAEEVEQANGTLKLPVMISGFDVKPWPEDKKGYGIDILRREDFKAIHDERLEGKYNRKTFSKVDELGLPLFDRKGQRTLYTRDQGLSRLYLNYVLDLGSYVEDLANSNSIGRVVLVSAEGANEDFLTNLQERLENRREGFESETGKYIKGLQELKVDIDKNLERLSR